MSTDTKWFYADGETSVGPFDEMTMAKMIGAGLIQAATQVVQEGGQSWGRLDETAFREFLITDDGQSDPIFHDPPFTNRAPSSVARRILVLFIAVYASLFRLAWNNTKRLATLLLRFRLRVPKPWRYVVDGLVAVCVLGSGFAMFSLDNPRGDDADGWYGYGYYLGDFCAGKVNSGELERSEAKSGHELWSLIGTIDSEKVDHMNEIDRRAAKEGYFDGLYGRRAQHTVRDMAP